jgi:ATP-dependent RNA helicase DDX49/DBP8
MPTDDAHAKRRRIRQEAREAVAAAAALAAVAECFDDLAVLGGPPAAAVDTVHSESSSSSSSASDDDESTYSDSDSLDSRGSRKRRKLSPQAEAEEPRIHITSAPSRVGTKIRRPALDHPAVGGRAIQVSVDADATFESLNVKPWLVGSLAAMAIKRPTGIQKGCIPEILSGRDCIGGSRTGSGKTVAFAVPILQKWAEDPFGIFALVLTPTRYVHEGWG